LCRHVTIPTATVGPSGARARDSINGVKSAEVIACTGLLRRGNDAWQVSFRFTVRLPDRPPEVWADDSWADLVGDSFTGVTLYLVADVALGDLEGDFARMELSVTLPKSVAWEGLDEESVAALAALEER
jgi:flavin-binding protein dodecin